MRWIKNECHIFDSLDELYQHAKFGEDRTTRAGCRCENVVFVFTGRCREAGTCRCRYCFYPVAKNQHFAPSVKTINWIEKRMALFDGHDEIYHHAKFGEDRTTRAGCRCENVVFFCFSVTLSIWSTVRSRGA